MGISLSDVYLTLPLYRRVKRELRPGMIVLCKCDKVQGGVKTRSMAIVDSFEKDGITPSQMRIIYGDNFKLTGSERIIDHRRGHKRGCTHD